ncbi:unnamed protein product [Brassicogethes aeneus]|uniref:Uncharacterized protein n=1 Tax=Brassicogethes aeneus TaxID=1431903 RepID=A0A9P0AXI3_BRAAE|nr:unnamed protein product [Brassicogethes aeneus]
MNSPEETKNVIQNEEMPSCSRVSSDNNANTTNNTDQSKGAIPKTKIVSKSCISTSKKIVKLNNNSETMAPMNCLVGNCGDMIKKNGYTENGSMSNIFNNSSLLNEHEANNGLGSKEPDDYDYNLRKLGISNEDDFVKLSYPDDLFACFGDQNHTPPKNDSDSCSDDTELLSVSDDGCIYTYKADYLADLPRSFFNLEIPPNENIEQPLVSVSREGNCSPEMDFLEMDFEPESTGDQDGLRTDLGDDNIAKDSFDSQFMLPKSELCGSRNVDKTILVNSDSVVNEVFHNNYDTFSEILKTFHLAKPSEQSEKAHLPHKTHHTESTVQSDFTNKEDLSQCWSKTSENETVMIWSESEAAAKQISQIAPSSCGATAVLNVLSALRLPIPTVDKIQEMVSTRFRANSAPLAEYLLSRSRAGCNHRDIIQGLYSASNGSVYARFFSMYPPRAINLYKWLAYWIKQGAIPIATLNLQKSEKNSAKEIADSWHHQMIYGVGPKGIYVANPSDCVDAKEMWPQLTSESVLLIRRSNVFPKFDFKTSMKDLMKISDVRWKEINVVGQVANLIRESRREVRLGSTVTSHIKIPADYKSGITLAIDVNSPAVSLLRQCPELPLIEGYF